MKRRGRTALVAGAAFAHVGCWEGERGVMVVVGRLGGLCWLRKVG